MSADFVMNLHGGTVLRIVSGSHVFYQWSKKNETIVTSKGLDRLTELVNKKQGGSDG